MNFNSAYFHLLAKILGGKKYGFTTKLISKFTNKVMEIKKGDWEKLCMFYQVFDWYVRDFETGSNIERWKDD